MRKLMCKIIHFSKFQKPLHFLCAIISIHIHCKTQKMDAFEI